MSEWTIGSRKSARRRPFQTKGPTAEKAVLSNGSTGKRNRKYVIWSYCVVNTVVLSNSPRETIEQSSLRCGISYGLPDKASYEPSPNTNDSEISDDNGDTDIYAQIHNLLKDYSKCVCFYFDAR